MNYRVIAFPCFMYIASLGMYLSFLQADMETHG